MPDEVEACSSPLPYIYLPAAAANPDIKADLADVEVAEGLVDTLDKGSELSFTDDFAFSGTIGGIPCPILISLRPRNRGNTLSSESTIANNKVTTVDTGETFTIPRGEPDEPPPGSLPNVDVDMVLDVVLRYRVYEGGTVWTIANGLYGEPDNSTDPSKTALNGGIIVRFGNGSSDIGEGETAVKVRTPL
ncbi:MAG: hypothetical protein LBB61_08170 [Treponema sp.]|jgi:hypothetical protein|nr:hypothetical protein [Treponema sp.]